MDPTSRSQNWWLLNLIKDLLYKLPGWSQVASYQTLSHRIFLQKPLRKSHRHLSPTALSESPDCQERSWSSASSRHVQSFLKWSGEPKDRWFLEASHPSTSQLGVLGVLFLRKSKSFTMKFYNDSLKKMFALLRFGGFLWRKMGLGFKEDLVFFKLQKNNPTAKA